MTRPPDPERRAATWARLSSSAASVFAEKGFAAATLNEIAATAGVTAGLTYRYVSSKDALFVRVLHDALDRVDAGITELSDSGSGTPASRIRALVDQYHEVVSPHPELAKLLSDPHARSIRDARLDERLNALASRATTWVSSLGPPSDLDIEEFALLMLSSLFSWFAPTPLAQVLGADADADPARLERHKAALSDLLTNALRPGAQ